MTGYIASMHKYEMAIVWLNEHKLFIYFVKWRNENSACIYYLISIII